MITNEFKYKLDFYYQQSLLYLVTFIIYVGAKSSITNQDLLKVILDPIAIIILIFVLGSFVTLFLNIIRNRKIIVTSDSIILKHNNDIKEIKLSDIEWAHIGKEISVRTAGSNQIVLLKVKKRLRIYKIRIGRYELGHELLSSLRALTLQLPKKQKRNLREIRNKFLQKR